MVKQAIEGVSLIDVPFLLQETYMTIGKKCFHAGMITVGKTFQTNVNLSAESHDQFCKIVGENNSIHHGAEPVIAGMYLLSLLGGVLGNEFPGDGTVLRRISDGSIKQRANFGQLIVHIKVTSIRLGVSDLNVTFTQGKKEIGDFKVKVVLPTKDHYENWLENQNADV